MKVPNDNQHLKLEELKNGMWVWDKKHKTYRFMSSVLDDVLNFKEFQYDFYDRAKIIINSRIVKFE